jgi:hypothetical protein
LQRGDAETALRALGSLMQKDPIDALESLNTTIATNGAGKQPGVGALLARIDELEQRLEGRFNSRLEEQAKEQRVGQLVQRADEIYGHISPEKHPFLAGLYKLQPEEVMTDLLRVGHNRVDLDGFLAETEQQLAAHFGAAPGGTGTQHPNGAQSSPAETLSPSLASHSGGSRKKTYEELQAEAEDLVPESFVRMGRGY